MPPGAPLQPLLLPPLLLTWLAASALAGPTLLPRSSLDRDTANVLHPALSTRWTTVPVRPLMAAVRRMEGGPSGPAVTTPQGTVSYQWGAGGFFLGFFTLLLCLLPFWRRATGEAPAQWAAVATAEGQRPRRKRRAASSTWEEGVHHVEFFPIQGWDKKVVSADRQRPSTRPPTAPQPPLKPPQQEKNDTRKRGAAQAVLPDDPSVIDPYDPKTFGFMEIGRIERPHGLQGEMKVSAVTDFGKELLCTPGVINIKPHNRRFPRPWTLVRGRTQGPNRYIIKLQGVNSIDEANLMRGHAVYASKLAENFPPLPEEECLLSDVVGLTVVNHVEDRPLGLVLSIVLGDDLCKKPGVMHDMLEVQLYDGTLGINQYRTVLVPLVPPILQEVDLEKKIVRIDPPDGLLEKCSRVCTRTVIIRGLLPP